jgi:NDP-sugar pyrophosphorylase family protein
LNILAFVADGYFIDIGVPEDLMKANIDFKIGKLL